MRLTALQLPPGADSSVDRRAVPDACGDDQVEAEQGQTLQPGALSVEDDDGCQQRGKEDGARIGERRGGEGGGGEVVSASRRGCRPSRMKLDEGLTRENWMSGTRMVLR